MRLLKVKNSIITSGFYPPNFWTQIGRKLSSLKNVWSIKSVNNLSQPIQRLSNHMNLCAIHQLLSILTCTRECNFQSQSDHL